MRRAVALLLVVLVALVVQGCGGGASTDSSGATDREAGNTTGSDVRITIPGRIYDAGCDRVADGGVLGHRGSVIAGPVEFHGAALFASKVQTKTFRPRGRWYAFKTVTEVEPETATILTVPTRYRSDFLLLYDSSHFGSPYTASDGAPAVAFGACARPRSGNRTYAGGFLVRQPGCYQVVAAPAAHPTEAGRAAINIAMGPNGCRVKQVPPPLADCLANLGLVFHPTGHYQGRIQSSDGAPYATLHRFPTQKEAMTYWKQQRPPIQAGLLGWVVAIYNKSGDESVKRKMQTCLMTRDPTTVFG